MTEDLFFIIGYLFFILILWSIPLLRIHLIYHKPELLGFSSAYIFLLADVKSESEKIVIFQKTWIDLNNYLVFLGISLGILGIILSAYNKSKQSNLKEITFELDKTKGKLEKLRNEYYNLCSDSIKDFFRLFFDTTEGNGRVSLYKHDGSSFQLLGRAAQNPEHSKRGLETYSENEGFIALGWQKEKFHIHDIPKWRGSGTEYRRFMKANCSISDERLLNLRMKSRSFYVYRFNNPKAQNPYGIIVFEKLNETQIETETIDKIFNIYGSQIVSLLKSMKSLYL